MKYQMVKDILYQMNQLPYTSQLEMEETKRALLEGDMPTTSEILAIFFQIGYDRISFNRFCPAGLEIHNLIILHSEKPVMGTRHWRSRIGHTLSIIGIEMMMESESPLIHSFYITSTGKFTILMLESCTCAEASKHVGA